MCGLFIGRWALAAMGRVRLDCTGVVGGMAVIVMLVAETAGRAKNRALCRVWKCGGYECDANIYSKTYTEWSDPF